jgi:hypothetical protein
VSEEITEEEKQARSMSYDSQLIYYNRLVSKYDAAARNLKNNPEKCGGEDHIRGYMEGLLDGMVLHNPNLNSVCMETQEGEVDDGSE